MKKKLLLIIGLLVGGLLVWIFTPAAPNTPSPSHVVTQEVQISDQGSIPSIILSPSLNNQLEPAIDVRRVVWSEKIGNYWQIVLFDLNDNSRHQLTSDPVDHVRPLISGDIVIWSQGESGNMGQIAGMNYATGQTLALPGGRATQPSIGGLSLVWAGTIDVSSFHRPIVHFDLQTQNDEILVESRGANWPVISGNIVVWEDWRNKSDSGYNADIYGYDLLTRREFPLVVAADNQERPSISGHIVVWRDNRNTHSLNDYDIYGYDMNAQREFLIAKGGGPAVEPKIAGDFVVWSNQVDVYAYDLKRLSLLTVAANGYINRAPAMAGTTIVWVRGENPGPSSHSQIVIGHIPVQP